MKKIQVIFAAACALFVASALSAMDFYEMPNGDIFAVPTSAEDVAIIDQALNAEPTPNRDALIAKNKQNRSTSTSTRTSTKSSKNDSDEPEHLTFNNQEFHKAQRKLLAYVRDVNWKTGMHLTERDNRPIECIKNFCSKILHLSETYWGGYAKFVDENYSEDVQKGNDELFNTLSKKITEESYRNALKLSLRGERRAMLTTKPFMLLVLTKDKYMRLKQLDPEIGKLADRMYQFFELRSVGMGKEFDENTDELLSIYKRGKGDAVSTWRVFKRFFVGYDQEDIEEFATHVASMTEEHLQGLAGEVTDELISEGKHPAAEKETLKQSVYNKLKSGEWKEDQEIIGALLDEDEEDSEMTPEKELERLPQLLSMMTEIKEHVEIKRKAAKYLEKTDPTYKEMGKEEKKRNKPKIKDKVKKYLEHLNDEQKQDLIEKYG